MSVVTTRLAGYLDFVRGLSIGALNQVITSGTNFVLSLYLIRYLSVTDFGIFGTMSAVAFMTAGFGNSTLLNQMVVLFPEKSEDERVAFVDSFLVVFLVLAGVLVAAAAAFVGIMWAMVQPLELPMALLVTVAFASGFLIKEYYVRLAYSLRREARALRVNLAVTIALAAIIGLLAYANVPLTATSILGWYALSMYAGVVVGQIETKLPMRFDVAQLRNSLSQAWVGGRWALINDVFYSCRHHAYILITAALAGPIGVAMINAAKLFWTPIQLLSTSVSQVLIARLVPLRQTDPLRLVRNGLIISAINFVCIVLYAMLIFFAFDMLAPLLLGSQLEGIESFVFAWFVVVLMGSLRFGLELVQVSMKRFKQLTFANFPVAVVALVSVYVLLTTVGPVGSIYALALADVVLTAILARMVYLAARTLGAPSQATDSHPR